MAETITPYQAAIEPDLGSFTLGTDFAGYMCQDCNSVAP
jgi:hypothetical protein